MREVAGQCRAGVWSSSSMSLLCDRGRLGARMIREDKRLRQCALTKTRGVLPRRPALPRVNGARFGQHGSMDNTPSLPSSPPARSLGRTGAEFLFHTRRWQVFGLTSALLFRSSYYPSLPGLPGPVPMMGVVLEYRCGAAPDSHRIPSSARRWLSPDTRAGGKME